MPCFILRYRAADYLPILAILIAGLGTGALLGIWLVERGLI